MKSFPKLNLFSEDKSPERDRILLVPGHLFFVESIPVSDAITAEELESLAVLTLEGMTPFPMDQLLWGYAIEPSHSHLLIFAAYQERLKTAGYDQLENYRQVYPDFLCLDNTAAEQPATLLLKAPEGWTAAAFEPKNRYPVDVSGVPAPPVDSEDDPPPDEEAHTGEILEPLDAQAYPLTETLTGPVLTYANDEGPIQFAGGGKTISSLPSADTWTADLRSREFGKKAQALRKRDRILWKAVSLAAVFAILLLALELARMGGNFLVQNRRATIEERSEHVARLGSRNELVNRLELHATGRLRPFKTLEVMNRTRPRTIYFTTIEAGDLNRFTIEGIASNPTEVNQYAQSLREMEYFESVVQQNNRVVSGQVTFTLQLVIDELPSTQVEVAEKNEESSAP